MKRILVTGGNGFLGKNIQLEFSKQKSVQQLLHPHFDVIFPTSEDCDILEYDEFDKFVFDYRPDTILNMVAICGGILANKNKPADFLAKNTQMGLNVYEVARNRGVKFVHSLGSVCAYGLKPPHFPFIEDDLFCSFPEKTNSGYGQAKRTLLMLGTTYREQYSIGGSHLIPVNMYGEHDHFDLVNSHVVPALINKFINAKENNLPEVFCWGTGIATRELMYAADASEAIVKAVLNDLNTELPINLGTSSEISIHDLALLIAELTEYSGKIVFTGEVSDGQPRRMLNVDRARDILKWEAKTDLKTGLIKTIEWYKNNKNR